jgi:hypothetical protein
LLKKKQPRVRARELFTLNSEEDPAGITNDQSGLVESRLRNAAHPNTKDLNPADANLPDTTTADIFQMDANPAFPNKFLAQFIIVIVCLIITLVITLSRSRPSTWTRVQIHTAINASEESTFGYLFNSKLFQTVIKNGKNLIHLEEITKKIINSPSKTGVQPVQGQISRGFGPQVNPLDGQQQYSTGVEWITLPETEVLAIADGIVVSVIPENSAGAVDGGGMITVDHGSGLRAIYYSLSRIRATPGAHIKKGFVLGQTLSSEFFLEVKRNGLLIDPLTLNLN